MACQVLAANLFKIQWISQDLGWNRNVHNRAGEINLCRIQPRKHVGPGDFGIYTLIIGRMKLHICIKTDGGQESIVAHCACE